MEQRCSTRPGLLYVSPSSPHTPTHPQAAATPQYQTRVVKNARFLFEYGETPETETRSGYNPLLEDFRNTCLFLASAGPGVAVNAGAGARVDVDEKMKEGK